MSKRHIVKYVRPSALPLPEYAYVVTEDMKPVAVFFDEKSAEREYSRETARPAGDSAYVVYVNKEGFLSAEGRTSLNVAEAAQFETRESANSARLKYIDEHPSVRGFLSVLEWT